MMFWSKLGTFGKTFVACFLFYFICKTFSN
jgi:hypothetical protein